VRVAPGTLDIAARERDLLFEASVLRDQERQRQELNALRVSYHRGQAERLRLTMTNLVQFHQGQVEKLTKGREE
jgi:hypothetical protein